MLFQPAHRQGVEGLDAIVHLVLVQQVAGGFGQGGGVALYLQLHNEGGLALEEGEYFFQKGNLLIRALQAVFPKLSGGELGCLHIRPGSTQQGVVMDHRQAAVPSQMDVQLRAVAVFRR